MQQLRKVPESILVAICLVFSTTLFAAENQCESCHQDSGFFVEYRKLHDYYQQWLQSPHQVAGVTCDNCHGGDASATSPDDAHAGVLPMNDTDSTLHIQRQPETCGQCHRANRNQFVQSKHHAALMRQRTAPTCTTCHPAMSSRPELRAIVLDACTQCHGEGNSDDLPLVTAQAEAVFQQLNIAGGLLGWTRIHYESHDWPGDSMQRVDELESRHRGIISSVHQFDLTETGTATQELVGDLRKILNEAGLAEE